MTRGRDSTSVGARSPRLAITLRGLKILEHPKTRPELWGVVVPWVRVRTMGQHGAVSHVWLFDLAGLAISASDGRAARPWPIASLHEGHIVSAMVNRARRGALRERAFDLRERDWFTRGGRIGATVLAAAMVAAGLAYGLLLAPSLLRGLGQLPPGLAIFSALVGVTMLVLPVVLFGVLAWSIVRAAWFSVRGLRVTPDALEFVESNGTRTRVLWRDLRRVRSGFLAWKIEMLDGRTVLCTPRLSRFVFEDFAQRQPGWREPTMRGTLWRVFWWFQAGGVAFALIAAWINAQGLGPLPQHPLAYYAMVGLAMPALAPLHLYGGNWLARASARRARRARARGRKSRRLPPANPAG